jgi:hypothetical protein
LRRRRGLLACAFTPSTRVDGVVEREDAGARLETTGTGCGGGGGGALSRSFSSDARSFE